MQLTVGEIAGAIGGRLLGDPDLAVASWHTDSRLVVPGGAFFALRGAEADGHAYLSQAALNGASVVVVERGAPALATGATSVVRVGDTWEALYALAREVLRRVRPVVVGITGSNGKTSTKELCAAALGVRHRVHRTAGNLNTETGLPLTVLGLEPGHEVAVLEMGMQAPGDIARLAALARPSIGVVTSIGSVHAQSFPDGRDGIAREKGGLLEALPESGLAVINADGPYAGVLAARTAAPVARYGFDGPVDAAGLRGEDYRQLPGGGVCFTARGWPVRLRLEGRHQAQNALGALLVARRLGVGLGEAAAAMAEVETANRLQRRAVQGGWTLVDDSYNASPESMRAAFSTVRGMGRSGRLLAVLGEMRELGAGAEAAHREIGDLAARTFERIAVLDLGWGAVLAQAAGAELLPDRDAALRWVRANARAGDLVLVKASHGVALDRLTEALLAC
ncbi:MAG: UDP-N-acetylmuramoyl-tripeptide--D-alanyl-D-alanine ligase [Candidatus Dormibacteraceae bacterium]